jgi:hypothetical protein
MKTVLVVLALGSAEVVEIGRRRPRRAYVDYFTTIPALSGDSRYRKNVTSVFSVRLSLRKGFRIAFLIRCPVKFTEEDVHPAQGGRNDDAIVDRIGSARQCQSEPMRLDIDRRLRKPRTSARIALISAKPSFVFVAPEANCSDRR